MRLSRFLPVLATASLLVTSVSPAGAAEPGVGSTAGTLTVLGLDVGDVLDLELLSDFGTANIDPDEGEPSAAAALSALKLASGLLGIDEEVPLLEAETTGEEQTASQDNTTLPANQLLGGQLLPASLRTLVDDTGALSSIGAGVADLTILEGLLGVSSTELGFDGNALTTQSDGTRTMTLDGLSALDLEALLAGLGVPLTDLPLDTILGLIEGLGLLPLLDSAIQQLGLPVDVSTEELLADPAAAITGLVEDLEALPELLATVDDTSLTETCESTDPLTDPLLGTVGDVLGEDLTEVCSDVTGAVEDLAAIADLEALVDQLLGDLLETILGVLDGAALLSLDVFDVQLLTTATDSLETSVADVTATLGGLSVGALDLGNVDLLGPAEQVSALVDQVEGTLSGVLGQVDPLLGDLVSVAVLDEVTSVTEDAGVITSLASFTGLEISLAPVDVDALLASLTGQTSIGDQLTGLGLPLPDASPILGLNELLSAAAPGTDLVTALSSGATMQIASVSQASTYEVLSASTPAAPAAPQPTLPRTGSNDAAWLVFAGLAALGALGLRRVVRIERP